MSYLLEHTDRDGDTVDIYDGGDDLTITATDRVTRMSASVYVSREQLLEALGVPVEPADVEDEDEEPETDEEKLNRLIDTDEAFLLAAARAILAPEPSPSSGLFSGAPVIIPARDLIDIADRLRRD